MVDEPIETKSRLPSRETAKSRVQCRLVIGLQYTTTPGRAVWATGALRPRPDQAEALALALLSAVGEWRADQATAAWTMPACTEVAR